MKYLMPWADRTLRRVLRRGRRLHDDDSGQSTTEYVIILVGISVVTIGVCLAYGEDLIRLFTAADAEVDQMADVEL